MKKLNVLIILLCAVGFCYGQSAAWDGTTKTPVTPNGLKYVITTPAQLAWIADACATDEAAREFEGKEVIINADLDLGNKEWKPIGSPEHPFRGHFIGNNHNIKNLKITQSSMECVGLFGYIQGQSGVHAKIDSIYVTSSTITGGNNVGVLCGSALNTEFVHCGIKTATVNGVSKVGGLIGAMKNSTVYISYTKGMTINVSNEWGGLFVGYNDSTFQSTFKISNCYAKGKVTCANHGGGFVGYNGNKGNIEHCYCIIQFAGKVADCKNLGLFCAVNESNAKLNNCVYNSNINGNMTDSAVFENKNDISEQVDVWSSTKDGMTALNFFTNFTSDQGARGKWKQDFNLQAGTGFSINEGHPILLWEYLANVSVKEAKEVQVSVYPNPVRNTLYIKSMGNEIKEIVIMDLLGKSMPQPNETEAIDMSQFKPGIYLIRITTKQGSTVTHKIVKQ